MSLSRSDNNHPLDVFHSFHGFCTLGYGAPKRGIEEEKKDRGFLPSSLLAPVTQDVSNIVSF